MITPVSRPLAILLVVLVVTAAVIDWRRRQIPNWLTVPALGVAVVLHAGGESWAGLGKALGGFGVGFAVFLPLLLLKGMGAGDVKLMAVVGTIVGAANCVVVFVFTALAGGLLAVGLQLSRGQLGATLGNAVFILAELARGRRPDENRPELALGGVKAVALPYAIPIAVGAMGWLGISGSV